jgi:hypothetical protein
MRDIKSCEHYKRLQHPYIQVCRHINDSRKYGTFKDNDLYDKFIKNNDNKHSYDYYKKKLYTKEYLLFFGYKYICFEVIIPFNKLNKDIADIYVFGNFYKIKKKSKQLILQHIIHKIKKRYDHYIKKIVLHDQTNFVFYENGIRSMNDMYFLIYGNYFYVKNYNFELYHKAYSRYELCFLLEQHRKKYQMLNSNMEQTTSQISELYNKNKRYYHKHYLPNFLKKKNDEMLHIFSILSSYSSIPIFLKSYTFINRSNYSDFISVLRDLLGILFYKFNFIYYL